mgnify:CR=1 FL=1
MAEMRNAYVFMHIYVEEGFTDKQKTYKRLILMVYF